MTFLGDKHVLSERRAQPRRVDEGGGEVIAEGAPEEVAEVARSYTGGYLKPLLQEPRTEPITASKRKARSTPAMREREPAE